MYIHILYMLYYSHSINSRWQDGKMVRVRNGTGIPMGIGVSWGSTEEDEDETRDDAAHAIVCAASFLIGVVVVCGGTR